MRIEAALGRLPDAGYIAALGRAIDAVHRCVCGVSRWHSGRRVIVF